MVDDLAARQDELLVNRCVGDVPQPVREASFTGPVLGDRFDQPVSEVAAGGGEDRARSNSWIADP